MIKTFDRKNETDLEYSARFVAFLKSISYEGKIFIQGWTKTYMYSEKI